MKKTLLALVIVLATGTLCAQEATKQTFNRNILLEQFTTVNCGWCPSGADRITEAIGTINYVIWIKHHAGFGEDFLTNDIHRAYLPFYGGSTFAPAMMVDRTRFSNDDAGPVTSVGQSGAIRGLFSRARQVDTYCKIYPLEVNYNNNTRTISGTVTGRFGDDNTWDGNTHITLFLVEDSIVGEQHDYTAHGNWVDYVHMGTVRAVITDLWGDPLTVDPSDRSFAHNYSFTLPDGYTFQHCKVVAFVSQHDATDINNRPVLNAAQSGYLVHNLGIAETNLGSTLQLFPNPANSHVVLEADESIETVSIVNSLGQKVYEQTTIGRQQTAVNISAWPKGIYLVTVRTAHGTATRKLCKK